MKVGDSKDREQECYSIPRVLQLSQLVMSSDKRVSQYGHSMGNERDEIVRFLPLSSLPLSFKSYAKKREKTTWNV